MYAAYLYIQRALLSDRSAPPPPAPRTPAPDGPTGLEAEAPRTLRARLFGQPLQQHRLLDLGPDGPANRALGR